VLLQKNLKWTPAAVVVAPVDSIQSMLPLTGPNSQPCLPNCQPQHPARRQFLLRQIPLPHPPRPQFQP
jgi:hypothetical protein